MQKNYKSALTSLYEGYINSAKVRKIPFYLSMEEFKLLTEQNCYYCGAPPEAKKIINKSILGAYIFNGIDRLDSKGSYSIKNSVACCKVCNWMKRCLSEPEFFTHINLIFEGTSE